MCVCVQAKGFTFVNVDEGWFIGRDAKTLDMIADPKFFPSGMPPSAASWPQKAPAVAVCGAEGAPRGRPSAPLARVFGPNH